jgi:hypothetical protein
MNFYTLKWGDKYGPEYVNRLYGSLATWYDQPFTLTCYTDNYKNIRDEVNIKPISDLRPYDTNRVFTYEKLILLEKYERGVWIDLDVLIHKNVTEDVITTDGSFIMIWNHWNNYYEKSLRWYGKGVSCHVNSSFVKWDNADWLVKYTHDNWDKIEWTYKSLDKYLFYQHHRKKNLRYWESDLVSNFNVEGFELKNKITIFNTSHIKANNLLDVGYELHEAGKDVTDIWTGYEHA